MAPAESDPVAGSSTERWRRLPDLVLTLKVGKEVLELGIMLKVGSAEAGDSCECDTVCENAEGAEGVEAGENAKGGERRRCLSS